MRQSNVMIKYKFTGKMEVKMLSSFSIFYPIEGTANAYNRVDAQNQFVASARLQATKLHPLFQDVIVEVETTELVEGTSDDNNSSN